VEVVHRDRGRGFAGICDVTHPAMDRYHRTIHDASFRDSSSDGTE
jgi:hypothetical protein